MPQPITRPARIVCRPIRSRSRLEQCRTAAETQMAASGKSSLISLVGLSDAYDGAGPRHSDYTVDATQSDSMQKERDSGAAATPRNERMRPERTNKRRAEMRPHFTLIEGEQSS